MADEDAESFLSFQMDDTLVMKARKTVLRKVGWKVRRLGTLRLVYTFSCIVRNSQKELDRVPQPQHLNQPDLQEFIMNTPFKAYILLHLIENNAL